jgi:hypothetical protein
VDKYLLHGNIIADRTLMRKSELVRSIRSLAHRGLPQAKNESKAIINNDVFVNGYKFGCFRHGVSMSSCKPYEKALIRTVPVMKKLGCTGR